MKNSIPARGTAHGAPHFLIVGACKSGTTTLYDDLAEHPDAGLPSDKEPDVLHKADTPSAALDIWRRHFGTIDAGKKVRGEASTRYTMAPEFEDVSALAREALGPDTKIIYIMRRPTDRIVSQLAHDFAAGRLRQPDYDRAALEDSRYVSWSDYARQLVPWIRAFGRPNVLPLIFEEYIAARHETARTVASFVGLDPDLLPPRHAVSNARGQQRVGRAAWINTFIGSDGYRQNIRPLIPDKLIQAGRLALTRSREIPPVRLRPDTMAELERRLAHVRSDLQQLGIETAAW